MECVLQWLDELDDLTATCLFVWHRVSPACLYASLILAILVHPASAGRLALLSAYVLAELALIGVVVWGCAGLLALRFDRRLAARA